MIRGQVNPQNEAFISLFVAGPGDAETRLGFLIDTGFSGQLTIPPDAVARLGLPYDRSGIYSLADGASVELDIYIATIQRESISRQVEVLAMPGGPLAGMALLQGHRVLIDVIDGGEVVIESRA